MFSKATPHRRLSTHHIHSSACPIQSTKTVLLKTVGSLQLLT